MKKRKTKTKAWREDFRRPVKAAKKTRRQAQKDRRDQP